MSDSFPLPSPSKDYTTTYLKVGLVVVLAKGLRLVGHPIVHEGPRELIEFLKKTNLLQLEIIDFILTMLSPETGKSIAEVKALLKHAEEVMAKVEGDFEDIRRGIAIFEEMSTGH